MVSGSRGLPRVPSSGVPSAQDRWVDPQGTSIDQSQVAERPRNARAADEQNAETMLPGASYGSRQP